MSSSTAPLRAAAWLALALVITLAACGGGAPAGDEGSTPDEAGGVIAAPATVGAGGSTVSALDGAVQLEIPAGALAEDVEIRIEEATTAELPAEITDLVTVNRVLRLEPPGLQFDQPVRLTMRLPGGTTDDDGGEVALPFLVVRSGDTYEFPDNQLAAFDLDSGELVLSADLHHFSEVWDNLPRDGGIRVRYSGVPAEWRVGEASQFTVTSTITQSAASSLSFIELTWESWNNSPLRPVLICGDGCDMGILDANREQTLSRQDRYWCAEAGQARWSAKISFGDDLAQAVYSFLGGGRSSAALFERGTPNYTSEAFRSIRCIASGGAASGGGGVALDPPRLTSLRSELRAPVTTYAIAVAGAGNLTFEWTMSGEQCGTPRAPWTQSGPIVQWSHSDQPPDNCAHASTDHGVAVTVTVSQNGVAQFTCTIRGTETQFPDWSAACDPPQGTR